MRLIDQELASMMEQAGVTKVADIRPASLHRIG